MNNILEQLVDSYTYLSVFLLLLIENLFPPIPSEIVLLSAGTLITKYQLSFSLVLFSSTLGAYVGAIILYYVGRYFDETKVISIITSKYWRFLGFKAQDITKSYQMFVHKSGSIVFFARLIPIVRSLISLPAGSSNMNFLKFSYLTILGTLIWNTILIVLGMLFYQSIQLINTSISMYAIIVLIIFVLGYIIYRIKHRK